MKIISSWSGGKDSCFALMQAVSQGHTLIVLLNRQLKENPGLENRIFNIEKHTRTAIALKSSSAAKGKAGGGGTTPPALYVGSVSIPVIVNILEDANHPVINRNMNGRQCLSRQN